MCGLTMEENNQNNLYKNIETHLSLTVWLFIGAVCLIVIGFVIVFYIIYGGIDRNNLPIILIVAFSGMAGGLVSSLTKAQQYKNLLKQKEYADLKNIPPYKVIIFSFIPPVIGAIAAILLYGIFAGEMIEGSLFPHFKYINANTIHDNFVYAVTSWRPEEAIDYIKCLVWGFVAGFSERFVPNILENFTNTNEK